MSGPESSDVEVELRLPQGGDSTVADAINLLSENGFKARLSVCIPYSTDSSVSLIGPEEVIIEIEEWVEEIRLGFIKKITQKISIKPVD